MTAQSYLDGRLLLAMPGMFDTRFEKSVNVLCVHDEQGALGIGIAQVREGLRMRGLLEEIGIDPGVAPDREVLHGGPVEPGRGFVLHSLDWSGDSTITVGGSDAEGDQPPVEPFCALTASMDVLRAIAEGRGPEHWLMALGYAGWGPGQLENEMRHHGWYAAGGHGPVLFDTPTEGRWMAAWRAEGIDPALLSNETGSA